MLHHQTNIKARLVGLFELIRYGCAGLGFFLIYQPNITEPELFNTLLLFIIVPLAGLTGLESIFLSEASAEARGREIGSAYQTQSGLNNLSTALTALIVWYFQWGKQASLTVLFVLLIFLTLSSMNHAYEYFIKNNKKHIHLMRLFLTIGLISACIPVVIHHIIS